MSLANYKPRSHFFRNKRNWLAALAWVERERERLAYCGGVGDGRGLSEVLPDVEETAFLQVWDYSGEAAQKV